MKTHILTLLILIAGVSYSLALINSFSTNQVAFAHGGSNNECEDIQGNDTLATGDEDERTYTAPSGQVISSVCIKTGIGGPPNTTPPFGDGHSEQLGNGDYVDSEDGKCYTISGVGSHEVTVTRNFESNTCKGISHIDIYLTSENVSPSPSNTLTPTETITPTETVTPSPTDQVSPTPTDQPTVTPTLTPSPTGGTGGPCEEFNGNGICIDIECDGNADCEFSNGTPTPTPTQTDEEPTPTVTATVTPTPGNGTGGPGDGQSDGKSDGKSDGQSDGRGGQQAVLGAATGGGQVLGASTMAPTGTFIQTLSNTLLTLGLTFLGMSGISYAKKRKTN